MLCKLNCIIPCFFICFVFLINNDTLQSTENIQEFMQSKKILAELLKDL